MCIYRLVKIFEDFQDTYMCTLGDFVISLRNLFILFPRNSPRLDLSLFVKLLKFCLTGTSNKEFNQIEN